MTETIDFEKMNGIVPVVVQDALDGTVLMLGFMNQEALKRTLEERQVVFWSRSKQRLWKKGETSGNYLDLVSLETDCDQDALLVKAIPRGPVCHTGERSCFKNAEPSVQYGVLNRLVAIIQKRKQELPQKSYTTELFRRGLPFIGQKVGEEAVELAIAAQYQDQRRCVEEAADLVYHVLVLLAAKEIGVTEVLRELEERMVKGK
jgi:phosphoribosyl-AMP cyclohydrolase / phosphoribosyl-ATP pyrophosphohydrolase